MFLKVFLLSDIVAGSSDCIVSQFWDRPHPADSPYLWPCSPTPTLVSWTLWHKALFMSLHLGQNQRLALPLGKWYAQTQPWGWYYHTDTNYLWLETPTQWIHHGGIPQCTWQHSFYGQGKVAHPPSLKDLKKATMAICGQKVILTGYDACNQADCKQDFCQTMLAMVFFRQWGLSLYLAGVQRELQDALSQGIGYAVSDGFLYKDKTGAAAWIIEGLTSNLQLTGQWHMLGQAADQSSFQSQLAGLVRVLYTLTFWPPKSVKPPLQLACDGLSVITCLTLHDQLTLQNLTLIYWRWPEIC